MKLFEHEAKKILEQHGISIPRGKVASTTSEAEEVAREIGKPVALKSQILVSGRGKAGGIQFANGPDEAKRIASHLIGSVVKECEVTTLLVEEKLDIAKQFYASITIDRQAKTYIILISDSGGVDIEEVARVSPDSVKRHRIDYTAGFTESNAMAMLEQFKLNKTDATRLADIMQALYQITRQYDAELVEINPLVQVSSGEFIAADARIIIDDNAIFRHGEFKERNLARTDDTPREAEARKQNLAYVDLDGNIGIIGNGAGLVMATIDLVQFMGGRPANFLDIGGGGNADVTKKGIMLVTSKPEVKAVLVNVLGGITRCDVVAQALVQVYNESTTIKPMIVRLAGTNEEEGMQILEQAGIKSYNDIEEAVAEVIKTLGE